MEEKKDERFLAHSIVLGFIPSGSSRGFSAIIVTVAGCNLRCKYCSRYSVSRTGENTLDEEYVLEMMQKHPNIKRVFITGGEPCMRRNMKHFIETITEKGYEVIMETNGSMWPQGFYKAAHGLSKVVIRPKMSYNRPSMYEDTKIHEKENNSWNYFDYFMHYSKSYEFHYEVGCEMDVEAVKKHIKTHEIPNEKVWLSSRKDIDMEAMEKINEMLETACLEMGWNLDK